MILERARYLKEPNPPTVEATDELRARVSEILRDIERGGLDAVRRYSQELDGWAPEHLEVQVQESKLDLYQSRLSNFGSLFVGREATVVYGDKAVGTNHVLPTSRAARYTGGLWVGKFLKTCTYQRMSAQGTRLVAPTAAAISHAEHFEGHALTAEIRLRQLEDTTS